MRNVVTKLIATLMLATLAQTAAAQYPNKTIRLVVPFPAGSATDTVARILGNGLSASLGQQVIVENKAGADGALAATEVVKAAPDGYTMLVATNSPMAAVPALRKQPPYDPIRDFTPISMIGRYTFFLYANAQLPVNNIAELIAYAKANPGKLAYATGNTTGIVATAQILSLAGDLKMLHVPYKGEPAAVIDLVSNRVQLMISTPFTAGVHAAEGKLKMLAITLPSRSALAPDVPTFAEAGIKGFSVQSWAALYAPANLPAELLTRLNTAVNAVLNRADIKEQLDQKQFLVQGSTSEALGAFTKEQAATYVKILRDAGVQPE
jgi:tripartite-type tricarboxylate transporter receptor subunit TctC